MLTHTKKELEDLQAKHTIKYSEKDKKDTLDRFMKAHPKLMAFKPEIKLWFMDECFASDTDEAFTFDPPIPDITINRPFIFDTRLAPKEFDGIVVNLWLSVFDYPEGYFQKEEDFYDEVEFKRFINDNLGEIRTKFNTPELSKQEAFEVMAGDLF